MITRIGLLLLAGLAGLSLTGELWSFTTFVRADLGEPGPPGELLLARLILLGLEESDSASFPASVRVRLWPGRVGGSSGSWKLYWG